MKNKKQGFAFLPVIIVIILLGAGGYYAWNKQTVVTPAPEVVVQPISTPEPTPKPAVPAPEPVVSVTIDAWGIFQQFVVAAQAHDLAKVASFSAKPLPNCADKCNQLLDFMLQAANVNTWQKSDFVNRQEDSKQIILSTNPVKTVETSGPSASINVIYFANLNGGWKIVKFGPQGWGGQVDEAGLQAMMRDTDQDGLTDQQETCQGASKYSGKCVPTDPNKRDTNGDGWWDGVEAALK